METRPRGIIFDLDGTLLDTLTDITNATNVAMAAAGRPSCTPDQVRGYVGSGVDVLVTRTSGLTDPERVAELVDILRDHYSKHALDNTHPYPGVAEMLDAISAASIPMCIFSNKPHPYTVQTADALLSKWSFAAVLGESQENPRKPDPVVAWRLADLMGLPHDAVVIVGDSEVDANTASNAGMPGVGVTWGFRDREVLEQAGADPIINQPHELLPVLGIDSAP